MNGKIDIIIPWVDGNDAGWQEQKRNYMEAEHLTEIGEPGIRYQSWDNLQYVLRGIESYMPWVHKVFLVTCGHLPQWINLDCERLIVVKHSDYIPGKYLPTFNSNVIEMNYFRIKELSENFILFNDDLFLAQPIEENYYFQDGFPCEEAVETHFALKGEMTQQMLYAFINNMLILNRNFNKTEVIKKNWMKWFDPVYGERVEQNIFLRYWRNFESFVYPHEAKPMKKSILREIWDKEPEMLDIASRNRVRTYSDVTQQLVSMWQICSGDFIPHKCNGRYFIVDKENCKEIADMIRGHKYPVFSLNEKNTEDFDIIKKEITNALEDILPDKSAFEW